jgi:hypothetical protein
MSYNNVITRSGSGGSNLVPVEYAAQIMSAIPQESAALQMFAKVPMGTYQERVPVLSALPQAYFVQGEASGTYGAGAGLKQTTSAAWEGRILQAEEIACIVPVPENLIADSQYDLWGSLTPHIASAIGRALDNAVFFGVNAPASFGAALVDQAVLNSNYVTLGTAAQSAGSLANDIAQLFATVEQDGYEVDGAIAKTTMRARVRNARTTFGSELTEIDVNEWYGQPVKYPMRGLWPATPSAFTGTTTSTSPTVTTIASTVGLNAGDVVTGAGIPANTTIKSVDSATQITLDQNATASAAVTITPVAPTAVVGDFSQGLLGVRQDITWKVLDQAALFDNNGALIINLPQQDAVALRVVARFAYQTANVVTYDNQVESMRWPFGVAIG